MRWVYDHMLVARLRANVIRSQSKEKIFTESPLCARACDFYCIYFSVEAHKGIIFIPVWGKWELGSRHYWSYVLSVEAVVRECLERASYSHWCCDQSPSFHFWSSVAVGKLLIISSTLTSGRIWGGLGNFKAKKKKPVDYCVRNLMQISFKSLEESLNLSVMSQF